jgi:type II secretory ATPase GspE/PulE/Tfp pilus assembly ATPase PilB-like protein
MEMDAELTRLYLAQASTDLLRAAALASGMKTLRRDALEKVFAGLTSLDEVARVIV